MSRVFLDEGIKELASWIPQSNTVILTGAGMDTESNIPDFRGKNGWWKNIDPRQLSSIETFKQNYELFQEFYGKRLKELEEVKPHDGHYVLAKLQEMGLVKSIATQNVSGLHAVAGSKNIYELHGNLRTIKCNNCGHRAVSKDFIEGKRCAHCKSKYLRPEITLFGESLPARAWENSYNDISQCDLLIVIGTSLEVYPVNQLPLAVKGKTVLINNEDVGQNYSFDLTLLGSAKEILLELDNNLNG